MAERLVPGPVKELALQEVSNNDGKLRIVQVIEIKKIGSQSGSGTASERFRLIVSDSEYYCQAMLATQLNAMITNKEIERYCLIGIKDCLCNAVNSRRIAIILGVDVLSPPLPGTIGNPMNSEDLVADPSAAATVERQQNGSSAPSFLPKAEQETFSPGPARPQRLFEEHQRGEERPNDRPHQAAAANYSGDRNSSEFGGGGGGVGGGGGNRNGAQYQGGYNQSQNNYNAGYQGNGPNNGMNGGGRGGYDGGAGGYNGGGGRGGGYNGGGGGSNNGGGGYGGRGGGGGGDRFNGGGGGSGYGGSGYGRGGGGGAMERNMTAGPPIDIAALTPYINGWTIQGRLTVKSAMRTYKNARGEGRLFNIDLMDSTGDIRGTFFNDDADKWFAILNTNKVYKVRGGTIKNANPQYNQTRSDYEITFSRDTVFEALPDSQAPQIRFSFRSVTDIEATDPNTTVDVLAVVQDAAPISQVVIKSGANAGNTIHKRDVVLVDQGSKTIKLTLWDDHKDKVQETGHNNPVIAIKGVRVSDFGGRSLSTTRSSMVELNPDLPAAHAMKGWYEMQGQGTFTSVSGGLGGGGKDPRKTCAAIKDERLGHSEKPDYFTLRGWVTYFKHDGTWNYPANPETKKKVVQQGEQWYDEAQDRTIERCERRYVLSLSCSDHTGSSWFSAFEDQGRVLLGTSADELQEVKDRGTSDFEGTFQQAIFKPYVFKVRAKAEKWQDEERVKCTLLEVTPLDWKAGAQELRDLIAAQLAP